jgi:hypothetical protein
MESRDFRVRHDDEFESEISLQTSHRLLRLIHSSRNFCTRSMKKKKSRFFHCRTFEVINLCFHARSLLGRRGESELCAHWDVVNNRVSQLLCFFGVAAKSR